MSSDFYRAFEEKHRGAREMIKARLEVYLPFVEGVAHIHSGMRVLDLGCGRGEWLELMKEHGIDAEGVDLDAGMLSASKALDLKVTTQDALTHLEAQPDGSHGIISAFHLVEHIPFETLQRLVQEARRVLLPGGLLIMETPNPENLVVGSANFYLDPTHIRPIPAPLLAFLPEFYNFARWKVLRLQEPKSAENEQSVTLGNVLNDVSPDYAVVAQSPGDLAQLSALNQAFAVDYGISLTRLTQRFDKGLQTSLTNMRDRVERQLETLQDRVQELENRNHAMQARLAEVQACAEERLHAAQVEARSLRGSLSWRITAPLRAAVDVLLFMAGRKPCPVTPRRWFRSAVLSALGRPRLVALVHRCLKPFPRVHRAATRTITGVALSKQPATQGEQGRSGQAEDVGLLHLSPEAQRIYADLTAEVERAGKAGS